MTDNMMEMRAAFLKKKNAIRKELDTLGVLKRGEKNTFDRYSYFSEAQYKQLFTKLLSKTGLELRSSVVSMEQYTGTDKQPFGRLVTVEFELSDIDTGYFESSNVIGEGLDKGDKALYKAYTGALKYYLADTFMVATGDDPERDQMDLTVKDQKPETKPEPKKALKQQIDILRERYTGANLEKLLKANNIEKIEDLPLAKATELINKLNRRKTND